MAPGAEDRYTPDKVFFGSMLFMGMVAATLLILTICMVRKRSNRLKNMEAFKAGQKMMMSEDAEFLQSQLGKELKRRLLLGDMNKFEEISKKEQAELRKYLRDDCEFRGYLKTAKAVLKKKGAMKAKKLPKTVGKIFRLSEEFDSDSDASDKDNKTYRKGTK